MWLLSKAGWGGHTKEGLVECRGALLCRTGVAAAHLHRDGRAAGRHLSVNKQRTTHEQPKLYMHSWIA